MWAHNTLQWVVQWILKLLHWHFSTMYVYCGGGSTSSKYIVAWQLKTLWGQTSHQRVMTGSVKWAYHIVHPLLRSPRIHVRYYTPLYKPSCLILKANCFGSNTTLGPSVATDGQELLNNVWCYHKHGFLSTCAFWVNSRSMSA